MLDVENLYGRWVKTLLIVFNDEVYDDFVRRILLFVAALCDHQGIDEWGVVAKHIKNYHERPQDAEAKHPVGCKNHSFGEVLEEVYRDPYDANKYILSLDSPRNCTVKSVCA